MTTINSNQIEEFIEATNNWELEKLYIDLASTKGKALTPVEKKFLRGLLCGCSPAEIATVVYQSRSSSTVRVYLSNGLYKYIEEMLSTQAGYLIKVKNWSRVTYLLEKAGYKKDRLQLQPVNSNKQIPKEPEVNLIKIKSTPIIDWGAAIDVSNFQGRTTELTKIKQWVLQDHCRLVLLLGMAGIGKTAFSVKLAQEMQQDFEYIIWRSLRLAPTLEQILDELITALSPNLELKIADTVEHKLSQLIDCLRSARCLIVLDNLDSLLTSKNEYIEASSSNQEKSAITCLLSPIKYHQGYEVYQELIRRIGETSHQSCLILTSREKIPEIAALEGEKLPVRSWKITGLGKQESLSIIQRKGLSEPSEKELPVLLERYAGNPLFLQLVATAIQELFGGDIAEFLHQGNVVFGDVRLILDQQFNRLSQIEKNVMYWLAINQDFVSISQLQENTIPGLSPRLSQRLILEAVDLLQKRSLIEQQGGKFSQIPVLIDYTIERLIEENFKLSAEQKYCLLMQTILTARRQNHTRESHLKTEF
ncbi:NB-ARC domain-containing protein [Nostoc sp. UHCC 0870]|uniref:NB-ARC domain-containing protein n=1 Tax=Nostoc sp. UHCC 0870 TaxID=2914041 RepID=UPI001EE12E79|nr:NB-ARC domain-containing protein [Nostoc sp. UHCC 0870]UKP00711.1 NB-ARC domain-containing protein [Nostoc sp. UHCC 0870]